MKCLLTTIRRSPGGGESRSSTEIEAASIAIGRGTDQQIHVPDFHVALQHARLLSSKPGRYQLEVLSENGIVVNGLRRQGCTLSVGDTIKSGNTLIRVEPVPAGFDIALTVERSASEADDKRLEEKARHRGSGWIRFASWTMFLLILLIGLIDPVLNHFAPGNRLVQEALSLPGPDIWLPGPIAPPHEYFGHDCSTCHDKPFHPVADENCQACHQDVSRHMPSVHDDVADPATQRCEACHLEHGGAEELVMTSQSFCADCHVDTGRFTGKPALSGPATDFAREHPPFRVTLPELTSTGAERVRLPLSEASGAETSNLRFPHDEHLNPDGVDSPDGTVVMACSDCHRTETGGALMAAISFDQHCSSCHQLTFDLSAPNRAVPHGDLQAALDVLVDFYAQLSLRGGSDEVSIASLERATPAEALQWARKASQRVAMDLLEDRACVQCHEIERSSGPGVIGWTLPQVYINQSWLPGARFSHESHQVAECADCHAAQDSAASSDVLMPDIETCQECHGGENASRTLNSTCVDCHRFHNPEPVFELFKVIHHQGTLSLDAAPDLEAQGRSERGVDPRRRRPGDSQ